MSKATGGLRTVGCEECATRRQCVLGSVTPQTQRWLQQRVTRRTVPRGQNLCVEGERATTVHVIQVGTAIGYRRGLDGRSRPIGMAARGAGFGFFGVFDQPNLVDAVMASSGRVCSATVEDLREAGAADPAFSQALAAATVQSCGRIASWSEGMRMRGVVNQLAYLLLLLSQSQRQIVLELPTHVALAELLGTTRETIARGLTTLESEGSIQRLERKKCEIRRDSLLARVGANSEQAALAA